MRAKSQKEFDRLFPSLPKDPVQKDIVKKRIRKKNSLIPLETTEAKKLWEWAQYHPIAREHLVHIPNEQKTSWKNGKKLKAEGRIRGISDYFLRYPHKGNAGLWIELKRRDRSISKLTIEQATWLAQCIRVGYAAHVAYGADEAIKIIEDYLK